MRADPKETITVENVVASTGIGQELDLQSVAMDLEGADYDPEQFPGLVYRTTDPKSAALIFRSGKIVCTGANSIEAVHESLDIVFAELRALQIPIEDPEVTVQNIVTSADLGESLNLNAIAIGLGLEHIEYEPEQFPGLVYRTTDPKSAALIFRSGKIVCTGANSIDAVHESLAIVFDELRALDIPIDEPEVTVQNIVTSADLGESLNLNAIAIGLGLEHIEYEPEQFPGLVYRLDEPDVVALLFGSGKVVVTGGTSPEDAAAAVDVIVEELDGLGLLD